MIQTGSSNRIKTKSLTGTRRTVFFLLLLILVSGIRVNANTYYYVSGTYTTAGSWNTNPAGGGTAATVFTNSADVWIMSNTQTLSSAWTVAGQLQIGNGSTGNTVTISHSMTVGTLVVNNLATLALSTNPTFTGSGITVNNGGTLNQTVASTATSPTMAATQGATSTINFGSTTAHVLPAITFGNVTFSSSSASSGFSTGTTTIAGNFSQTAGTVTVNSTASSTATVNIGGTFSLTGTGAMILSSVATASATITVSGTTTINSTVTTEISFQTATATTGVSIFQANDDVTISGGTTNMVDWGKGAITGNYFGLQGNLTISGGKLMNTSSTTVNAKGFVFNGDGTTQVLSNTSTGAVASTECSYVVNNGASVQLSANLALGTGTTIHSAFTVSNGGTLDCSTYVISGGSTSGGGVLVNSGGTLITANTGGINSSVTATGSTFNAGANYVFDGAAAQVTGTSLPAAFVSPGSVSINNSHGVTLSQNTSFATGDTVNLQNGAFTLSHTLTMNTGSYIQRDNGTFSAAPTFGGAVNVVYTDLGTNASAVTTDVELPTSATALNTLTVNKYSSGGTITLKSGIAPTVNGALTLTSGVLNAATYNNSVVLKGNWTNNSDTAAFVPGTGTATFSGAAAQVIGGSMPTIFNNVSISNTSGGVSLGVDGNTINGTITLTTGILSAGSYDLNISGAWTNNEATTAFSAGTGMVIFNGAAAQTINGSFASSFHDLSVTNTSAAVAVNTNINVSGTLSVIGVGSVLSPAATVVINNAAAAGTISGTGSIQVTRITATADYVNQYKFSTNTLTGLQVDYAGAGAQTISSTVGSYGQLKTSTGGTKTLAGAVTVAGDLIIGSGTTLDVTASNYQLNVGGSWTNNGTFNSQSGAVYMTGTTTGLTLSGNMTGASKFYNLVFLGGAGAQWSFGTNKVEVASTFNISTGSVTSTSDTLTVHGNWYNGGTFNNNGGTVMFSQTLPSLVINGTTGGLVGTNKFNHLVFTGSGGAWSFSLGAADVAGNFIISAGSTVTAPSGTLQVAGNWTNNGTFTHNNGTVAFNKTGAQTISGPATAFNNLTVGSSSVTTISSSGHTVKGILLCNDTLNANGNLSLLSTSAQTALIDGSGSGDVLGNLTMQCYIDSGYGYKYISSPFAAATLSGLSGYINLAASFPAFYSYNENLNSAGWVIDTVASSVLSPLHGYAGNFGSSASPVTVSLTGVVSNHTVTTSLSNHNYTYTLGYNLVGNPYPSPIDWNAASGWTKTNIDNAVYYFNSGDTNQYTGTYSSYVGGISSDGIASNIIPSMQGFFVHVSSGAYPVAGTLTTTNSVRVNNLTPVFHKPSASADALLRLDASFSGDGSHADPVVIYFDDRATGPFNKDIDALKLMNTNVGVPSLYTVSTDGTDRYSIHALANIPDSTRLVPLGLQIQKDGLVTFNTRNLDNMPPGVHVYFYDTKTGTINDLSSTPKYRIFLGSGKYENRFFIMFTHGDKINIPGYDGALNAYTSGKKLFVYVTEGAGTLHITNMAGQVILTQQLTGTGYHQVDVEANTGIYVATLFSGMGKQSKKVFIGNE